MAAAYNVWPCPDGARLKLAGTRLGAEPPQWPIPTVSGLWYTSPFQACTKRRKGAVMGATDDCWWRSQQPGIKDQGLYECDRRSRSWHRDGETHAEANARRAKAKGETSAEARIRQHTANGETSTSARIRQYAAVGGSRQADEVAYTERHGFPRASRGDGFGNLAHAFRMLQQLHIRNAKWPYELTGSTGTVEDLHVQLRRPIVHTHSTTGCSLQPCRQYVVRKPFS